MDSMCDMICPAIARRLDPLRSRKLACTFQTYFSDNTQIRTSFLVFRRCLLVVAAPRCEHRTSSLRTRGHRASPHVLWMVHDILEHSEHDQKNTE